MPGTQAVQRRVTTTADFCELEAAAAGWDQRYSQMSPGSFEGRLELLQVGARQIMRETWSRRVRAQVAGLPGSFVAALPVQLGGATTWRGCRIGPDTAALLRPGQEGDMLGCENWDSIVLEFPEEDTRTVVSALAGHGEAFDELPERVELTSEAAENLRRASLDILDRSAETPDARWIERQNEQFIRLFLWHVLCASDNRTEKSPSAPAATLVRRASELGLSDHESVIGLAEICARLNVSLRSLHSAFEETLEIPPATWLRRIRLNRVHRALLKASPGETLIQDVAYDHGFTHMGHFCQHYRRHFGCTPTETLNTGRSATTQ